MEYVTVDCNSLPFAGLDRHENRAECLPISGGHEAIEDKIDGGIQQGQKVEHIAKGQIDEAMHIRSVDSVENGNQALGHFGEQKDAKDGQKQGRCAVRIDPKNGGDD
jgi:hypothetical protein